MTIPVLRVHLSAVTYPLATEEIIAWAQLRESRYVCAANVHMLMEAHDSSEFRSILNQADMVTPDGMPLVWMMRLKGLRGQERVRGLNLMLHIIEKSVSENIAVGFYGSSPIVIEKLKANLLTAHPGLNISYSFSPPYRDLTAEEDADIVQKINRSGARILFVGLGCPKQEKWMASHRGEIRAVMIGVGAAFDFYAGTLAQAPLWMQKSGLEWFFRLITEPRRLWQRYLYHNLRFIFFALIDALGMEIQQHT